jgi:hypothetical protein
VDPGTPVQCRVQTFHQHDAGALSREDALAIAVERLAHLRRDRPDPVEAAERLTAKGVRATAQGHIRVAAADRVEPVPHGIVARRAGRRDRQYLHIGQAQLTHDAGGEATRVDPLRQHRIDVLGATVELELDELVEVARLAIGRAHRDERPPRTDRVV